VTLYIVPVPIGNLGDITLRAIDVLRNVDFVVAEDTRYSLKLLNHLEIKKKLFSYYKPREEEKSAHIIRQLLTGKSAALISDSGTPAVSDPGCILVKKAIQQGIDIIPLPGPTAFVPALTASGLESGQFIFLGFPPRKKNQLRLFLQETANYPYTLIFYESPRRVREFLQTAAQVFGPRNFALAKEISKKNERIIRGRLDQLDAALAEETLLGEMSIVIDGRLGEKEPEEHIKIDTMDELFDYFKTRHNISKNQLKKVLMTK